MYPIPILSPFLFISSLCGAFIKFAGFSTHFYTLLHISVRKGGPPIVEKNASGCHGSNTHAYQFSTPCVLPLSSFKSEEVNAWRRSICCCSNNMWFSCKWCHTHWYQFSSPWVLPSASLRSEECLKLFDVVQAIICGCHGNMKLSCNMHA